MFHLLRSVVAALFVFSVPIAHAAEPTRKTVAILLFEGVEIIDYSGPYEVFYQAGYDVYTVAATKQPLRTVAGDGMLVTPRYTFADAPRADLILVPGGDVAAASKDSATLEWLKRAHASAAHTMTVCNGAFILANTGLLDGLRVTTTAGNIARLTRDYPALKVVSDQRVVDNGKVVATGGLTAGIDGALYMLDVMSGKGTAETAALGLEYDWRPNEPYLRAMMADRYIPRVRLSGVGEPLDRVKMKGDKEFWQFDLLMASKLSVAEALDMLSGTFEKGYQADGNWQPGSFRIGTKSVRKVDVRFKDREGRDWAGSLSVEPAATGQVRVRYTIHRVA
jgi:putative intracellular protease/amidase